MSVKRKRADAEDMPDPLGKSAAVSADVVGRDQLRAVQQRYRRPAYLSTDPDLPAIPRGADRPVRIYVDGVFDLFHQGHMRAIMQAKQAFPNVWLLVGAISDDTVHSRKGMTVMSSGERADCLRHCRYVDEVIPDAPWVMTAALMEKHEIDFVAHDAIPYASAKDKEDDVFAWLKDAGKFYATQRTEGISTTDIITRVVRDYDTFVRRNLRHGYTPADLNIGFLRAKRIQIEEQTQSLLGKSQRALTSFLKLFQMKSADEDEERAQSPSDSELKSSDSESASTRSPTRANSSESATTTRADSTHSSS
eukprot:m.659988 g.659988  ORF g.659988 m.659988 type:complete len:307 (-) comp58447_c0_seq10:264-1184(-)